MNAQVSSWWRRQNPETKLALLSIAIWMSTWWVIPRNAHNVREDISYINHIQKHQNEEITYQSVVVTDKGISYHHPWHYMGWLVRLADPYECFFTTLGFAVGFLVLLNLFSDTPMSVYALIFVPWFVCIFIVTRSIRPEGFIVLATALCLNSILNDRYYAVSMAVALAVLYMHPLGLIVVPAYLLGLLYRKPVLAFVALTAGLVVVNNFVDINNFTAWTNLYRYMHPKAVDYAGPVLFMKGTLWQHIVQFFEKFCWIPGYDDLPSMVAQRVSCFGALVYGAAVSRRWDVRVLFCLLYVTTAGLVNGAEYSCITDPFLVSGGFLVMKDNKWLRWFIGGNGIWMFGMTIHRALGANGFTLPYIVEKLRWAH